MKKAFISVVAIIMVCFMSVSVFATNGGFMSSPSANRAPELVEVEWENGGEEDFDVRVTSYSDRHLLPQSASDALEQEYDNIRNSNDLTELCPDLTDVIANSGVSADDLAVSDLFNVGYADGKNVKNGKGTFVLKSDNLENFVALLCFVDGEWKVVKGATVDGQNLTFKANLKGDTPFAIVVSGGSDKKSPATFDSNNVALWVVISATTMALLVVLVAKTKKNER